MSKEEDIAFMISVRKDGLFKKPYWTITDGERNWSGQFETFTIAELKARFPRFFKEQS